MSIIKTLRELFNGKKERRRMPSNRRKLVWHRDGKRCRYGIACNFDKVKYHMFHLDHIKPVSYHGIDYNTNLCVACAKCNLRRSNKYWIKPRPIPVWRKIFGIILIFWFKDIPKPIDFY